ncbi:50S ribosomal protein L31 [Candidatus Annandia adelgestsuga]|uniref:Large ribosomal subunit protein bL31 n=1 Tax=Candidatus Annandia adelgestsuga TaxID=1302411 RepID=A0A3Q9CMF4_9ENTR|nr:50S ribosomal protein L31 [Candidatus Annandia adelgestsuga]AZP36416.1 50S ribosomal protein L31 [Candidatus Annandia adelgestsuga]
MKKNIHPKFYSIMAKCSCGNNFNIKSTIHKNINIDVCSKCHPFYTGKQKIIDTGGRVDKFNKRFTGLINIK